MTAIEHEHVIAHGRPHDAVSDRRRSLLALAGPLAALSLALGSSIGPRAADTVSSDKVETARIISAVAADRGAAMWGGFFLIVGLLLLIPFFAGITAMIRERGAALATIGGSLAMVGAALGGVSQWFFFSEWQLTAPGVPASVGAIGLSSLPGVPAGILFLGFFGGLTLGWVLLVVAAWRSGVFARWQVVLFGLACVAVFVSHSVYSAGVLLIAAVPLARAVFYGSRNSSSKITMGHTHTPG